MNPIKEIAKLASILNKEGIQYMNDGRYVDAIGTISKALNVVKKNITDADDENDCDICCVCTSTPRSGFVKLDPMCIVSPNATITNSSYFMSSNAIYMQTPTEDCYITLQYFTTQSFILLYNLALAYHLSALHHHDDEMSTRALRKAASLYELAYSFHENEGIQCSIIQIMSIMNNLGHIHIMLHNPNAAKHYFQHLLSTIMYVNVTCGGNFHSSCDDIDGFVNNALSFMVTEEANASAA